jgi:hypothetical protein
MMKLIKMLTVAACAVSLLTFSAVADDKKDSKDEKLPACCAKAKADGKECTHKCCVAAKKEGKVCEKCSAKAEKKEDEKK